MTDSANAASANKTVDKSNMSPATNPAFSTTADEKPSASRVEALSDKWRRDEDMGSFRGIKDSLPRAKVSGADEAGSQTPNAAIGRIVGYTLSSADADAINTRRVYNGEPRPSGIRHVGEYAVSGQVFPMMITAVGEGNTASGQVFLNGNDTLWVRDVAQTGDGEGGKYHWPRRL